MMKSNSSPSSQHRTSSSSTSIITKTQLLNDNDDGGGGDDGDELNNTTTKLTRKSTNGFGVASMLVSSIRSRRIKEEIRRGKWREILERWDDTLSMKPNMLKRRIRQGIPQEYRGDAWQRLSGSETLMFNNKKSYQTLLQQFSGVEKRIMHDINRTFPKHQLFRHVQGVGQRSLFNVLRAYSVYDRSVKYCQGMGFVTGLFLCYMTEEETFWMLVAMMRNYDMAGIFKEPLTRVKRLLEVFETLIESQLPELAAHLRTIDLQPQTYATQWFMTVYLYSFPFDVVARVWDAFLAEGWTFIVRVALAILRIGQNQMLQQHDLESCMKYLKALPLQINPDTLIRSALEIRVHPSEISLRESRSLAAEAASAAEEDVMRIEEKREEKSIVKSVGEIVEGGVVVVVKKAVGDTRI